MKYVCLRVCVHTCVCVCAPWLLLAVAVLGASATLKWTEQAGVDVYPTQEPNNWQQRGSQPTTAKEDVHDDLNRRRRMPQHLSKAPKPGGIKVGFSHRWLLLCGVTGRGHKQACIGQHVLFS